MASTGKNSNRKRAYGNGRYNRYTNESYNTTSVAYETVPQYYPERKVTPKKDNRKLKERQERAERIRNKVMSFKFIVFGILICCGCIVIMSSYARVVEKREIISGLKTELSELKSENNALSAEIAEQTNLENIEKEAIERLGMAKPQQYQTIYINVPEESYTVQYSSNSNKENANEEKLSISNLFSKVFSIFDKD